MEITEILNNSATDACNIDLPNSNKAEIYYNMIFMKLEEGNREIYLDVKSFLEFYINSIDSRKFGYDKINQSKIISCLEALTPEERLNMFFFLKKQLIKNNLEKEWDRFENIYHRCRNQQLTIKKFWFLYPLNLLRFIYNKSVYSYPYLLLLLFIFILFNFLILLPNSLDIWISTFKIEYQAISKNFYLNHLSNILLGLFEIESDFKVIPINLLGTVLLLFGKIIKVIFVVKYVADKILKRIAIDE